LSVKGEVSIVLLCTERVIEQPGHALFG